MATKSILKTIVLKDSKKVVNFLSALEQSIEHETKEVCFSMPISNISKDIIKKLTCW